MKTPATRSPSLSCRIVRGWISVFGGDVSTAEAKGLGSGHLASCEECQRYFNACNALDRALMRDARVEPGVPEGLEQRIARAVHRSKPEPRPRRVPNMTAIFAGVAACVALAVVLVRQQSVVPDVKSIEDSFVFESQVWAKLNPSADAVLSGDPLQKEVDAVVSDARSALRFLERNFMPPASDNQTRKS